MNRLCKTKSIGEFLKMFREIHDVSLGELADKIGKHKGYIFDVEKGDRNKPVELVKALLESKNPKLLDEERYHLAGLLFQSFAIEYNQRIRETEKEIGITLEEVDENT